MTSPSPAPERESLIVRVLVPARPSRLRLGLLVALMLLWIAVLVILYFTTVKPLRDGRPTATQTVAASAAVACTI